MSRVLDTLIAENKRNKNSLHARHYSESDLNPNVIEQLENELEKVQKQSPETIETLYNDEDMAGKLLGLSLEEISELEKDLGKGSKEEKSGYRYKILPRIYSNIERIGSSPKLERKLISYYLRHRRRNKMHRLYGKRNNYFSEKSADYLLHEMYMELGRTLYFSWLSDVGDWFKSKALDLPAVKTIVKTVQYFVKKADDFWQLVKTHGLVEMLATLLGGGAGITTFVIMIGIGLHRYLGWHETAGGTWQDFITTVMYNLLALLGLIIFPALVGIIVYYIAKAIKAGISYTVKSVRKLLRPEAIKVYLKGMNLLTIILPRFSKLLSNKTMNTDAALELLSNFVKASQGDADAKKKIIDNIKELDKKTINFGKYITVNNPRDLWKILVKESDYNLSFSAEVADFVANKIGSVFNIDKKLESKSFAPSQYSDLEKISKNGEPNIGLPTGRDLPIELAILVMLTSPKITLTIRSDSASSDIIINLSNFIMAGSESIRDHIVEFLDAYMKAFADSRGQLSGIFKKAYEEKEHEK